MDQVDDNNPAHVQAFMQLFYQKIIGQNPNDTDELQRQQGNFNQANNIEQRVMFLELKKHTLKEEAAYNQTKSCCSMM